MILTSVLVLSGLTATTLAETILGVTIFSRHGDRTSKHYTGYQLTNLGFNQNFMVGSDYRARYIASGSPQQILGISADKYVPSQVYSSAPDQQVLLNTATAFLQGLYPPLNDIKGTASLASQTLNNGSSYINPLNGYQYVVLHGEDANSPDTIWIKGGDTCPAFTAASNTYANSTEFTTLLKSTLPFYQQFWPALKSVYDYTPSSLSYTNAYGIFDLLNVATIHNASNPAIANLTADQLFHLRTLADEHEFNLNYNVTVPLRAIGGSTLAAAIVSQLNQTVTSGGALKFSLLAGSYDTFLSFFGLANLTAANADFFGLPGYASTMSFELYTENNVTAFPTDAGDLNVRFLFRNGTEGALQAWPLFGGSVGMAWTDFVEKMNGVAVSTVGKWCSLCQSTVVFCAAYENGTATAAPATTMGGGSGGVSRVVAGVIGAMVTLGVVLVAGLGFWVVRRKKARSPVARAESGEKAPSLGSSPST